MTDPGHEGSDEPPENAESRPVDPDTRTQREAATDGATQESQDETNTRQGPAPADPGRDVTAYLTYGGLALLCLLALVATVRFYLSASRAIGIWVAPEFEPLIQAAFNLAVVLLAGVGISVLVRRLR